MPYKRQYFKITTDTGDVNRVVKGDTGPFTFGEITMIHVKQEGNDTGGDLEITAIPQVDTGSIGPSGSASSDTGHGFGLYTGVGVLGGDTGGVNLRFVPAIPIAFGSGSAAATDLSDTGYGPITLAGEKLRFKVRAGRVVKAGATNVTNIWVYTKEA